MVKLWCIQVVEVTLKAWKCSPSQRGRQRFRGNKGCNDCKVASFGVVSWCKKGAVAVRLVSLDVSSSQGTRFVLGIRVGRCLADGTALVCPMCTTVLSIFRSSR